MALSILTAVNAIASVDSHWGEVLLSTNGQRTMALGLKASSTGSPPSPTGGATHLLASTGQVSNLVKPQKNHQEKLLDGTSFGTAQGE